MEYSLQVILDAMTALLFVVLAHKVIAEYPPALPESENPRRELMEALIVWGIIFVSVVYIIAAMYVFDTYYPILKIGRLNLSLHVVLMLLIPFVLEVFIRRRPAGESGFQLPQAWLPTVVCIGFGIFSGVLIFILLRPDPYPYNQLLMGIMIPVFAEEWVYRSVVQSRLEKVFGQNRAWFLGGLLFGISHIPMDFFGPLWMATGERVLIASFLLLGQCAYGWLWGIFYMKTRSILPGMISHYCADFLAGILAFF